jgi:hypothetical protein
MGAPQIFLNFHGWQTLTAFSVTFYMFYENSDYGKNVDQKA